MHYNVESAKGDQIEKYKIWPFDNFMVLIQSGYKSVSLYIYMQTESIYGNGICLSYLTQLIY